MESIYKRYGKKRSYIGLTVILIALSIIIINITYQIKIRFSIEGQKFRCVSCTDKVILFCDNEDNKVTVTMGDSKQAGSYPMGVKYKIEYKNKVIKCDNSDWVNNGQVITLSDGREIQERFDAVAGNSDDKKVSVPFDVQLVRSIAGVYNFIKKGSMYFMLLVTIPLILLGLVYLIYPEKIWRFKHMLDVSGGEPTDWALSANKIGGIVSIVLALLLPVIIANR